MTLVSTVVFMGKTDAVRCFERRRERDGTITQARKAASRFQIRRVRKVEYELKQICLVERRGLVLTAHEKAGGQWTRYTPPEDPPASAYLVSCLALTGTPPRGFPAPPTLEINGCLYRLEI